MKWDSLTSEASLVWWVCEPSERRVAVGPPEASQLVAEGDGLRVLIDYQFNIIENIYSAKISLYI